MTEKLRVGIVGLGMIGISAGLALRRYQDRVTVIGHDASPESSSRAKRMGAVDKAEWNLINAVIDADRIILALPVNELRETLKAIASDLKPGCVLIDTAEVKTPVMAWAAELLPKDVHFVGGHPIVMAEQSDPEGARPDLFDRKLFCLTPDGRTDDTAVRLAADVVEALGGQPFFLDAAEHDGLTAGVEHLPAIMAGALLSVTTGGSGWSDMRKLAANQYLASTMLMAQGAKSAAASVVANRENLLHWLDTVVRELETLRGRVAEGDEEGLAEVFDSGLRAGQQLLAAQASGNWEQESFPADMPTSGSMFKDLLLGRRKQPTERAKRK